MKYEIPYENLATLKKKLASIESKCEKYGLDFYFNIVGDKYMKAMPRPTSDGDIVDEFVPCIIVDVEGCAYIDGFEFLAVIEHREHGNLVKCITDEPLDPKWRTAEPKCDHCGTNQNRKTTYLVRDMKTLEIKQLGKSCLKLYTGGISAEHATFFESFLKMIEDFDINGIDELPKGVDPYFEIKPVLAYAIEEVEKNGYHKKNEEHPTVNSVLAHLTNDKYKIDDRYWDKAEEEIEFVKKMDNTSDYIYNIQTLIEDGYMKDKDMGYICSIPSMYEREMSKEAERKAREEAKAKENADSEWIGKEGQKMEATIVSFNIMASFDNGYGIAHLVKMVTAEGNQLKWTTSNPYLGEVAEEDRWGSLGMGRPIEFTELLPCKIQFTVKSHDEYKGAKQTTVLRVKPVKGEMEKVFEPVKIDGVTYYKEK